MNWLVWLSTGVALLSPVSAVIALRNGRSLRDQNSSARAITRLRSRAKHRDKWKATPRRFGPPLAAIILAVALSAAVPLFADQFKRSPRVSSAGLTISSLANSVVYRPSSGKTISGVPMCRGNPGRPESVPGGSVDQGFAGPSGSSTVDTAQVTIDPDPTVIAHLSIAVNQRTVAEADSAAAGDTIFRFKPIHLLGHEIINLRISFTATSGKIITIYTSHASQNALGFAVHNSCSDGAPTFSSHGSQLVAALYRLSGHV